MRYLRVLTLVIATAISSASLCWAGSDSATDVFTLGAQQDAATLSSQAITRAACQLKRAGWYRHPNVSYATICYYAEVYPGCSQGIYAYNRRVSTNVLVTNWGAEFAYSCHVAVNGETYRGQWAIGASASQVSVKVYSSTLPVLPRVAGY